MLIYPVAATREGRVEARGRSVGSRLYSGGVSRETKEGRTVVKSHEGGSFKGSKQRRAAGYVRGRERLLGKP